LHAEVAWLSSTVTCKWANDIELNLFQDNPLRSII